MLHIHDLVDEYEHRLVVRWTTTALEHGAVGVEETAHEQVASFLRELHVALATSASEDRPSLHTDHMDDEPDLDKQRRPGLESAVAVRAFSALHGLLLELARDREVKISCAEHVTLASHVHAAITRAVELGPRQRERDTWKAAHELRNPLGSAMMALTMLRSRVDFGKDARLVDTLERNLKRVQGLVDDWTARAGRPAVSVESSGIGS
jgi:signal transduction histidine kinase